MRSGRRVVTSLELGITRRRRRSRSKFDVLLAKISTNAARDFFSLRRSTPTDRPTDYRPTTDRPLTDPTRPTDRPYTPRTARRKISAKIPKRSSRTLRRIRAPFVRVTIMVSCTSPSVCKRGVMLSLALLSCTLLGYAAGVQTDAQAMVSIYTDRTDRLTGILNFFFLQIVHAVLIKSVFIFVIYEKNGLKFIVYYELFN